MSDLTEKKRRPLRCGGAVITFAILALIGILVGCSPTYLEFRYSGIRFRPTYRWDTQDYLYLAFELLPVILFMLYTFIFYKKNRLNWLMGVVYGLLGFYCLYGIYNAVTGTGMVAVTALINLVFSVGMHITFMLAMISALRGSSNRVALVFTVVLGFVKQFIVLAVLCVNLQQLMRYNPEYLVISDLVHVFGMVFFYIALLIFGMANRNREEEPAPVEAPVVVPVEAPAEAARLSAEEALRMLAQKRDNGSITEEEYQALRAEIIRSL